MSITAQPLIALKNFILSPDHSTVTTNNFLLKLWVRVSANGATRGATAVEYGLMVALIAAVIITIVSAVGGGTEAGFGTFNDNFTAATQ